MIQSRDNKNFIVGDFGVVKSVYKVQMFSLLLKQVLIVHFEHFI